MAFFGGQVMLEANVRAPQARGKIQQSDFYISGAIVAFHPALSV